MATRKKVTAKMVDIANILPDDFKIMDIKDIEIQKTIINKLSAGIVFLSSYYIRFISTIFPIFETIYNNWDDKENVKIMIKRFNYLMRTYILSNSSFFDPNSKSYDLLNNSYTFSINVNNVDSDVVLSLTFINEEFKELFKEVKNLMMKKDIIDKDSFKRINNQIINIYNSYIGFLDDILYIFETDDLRKSINELINNIESDRDKANIDSVKDIYTESICMCKSLEEVYKLLIVIEYAIGSNINILDPMHVGMDIKQMYDYAFNPEKVEEIVDLLIPNEKQKYRS